MSHKCLWCCRKRYMVAGDGILHVCYLFTRSFTKVSSSCLGMTQSHRWCFEGNCLLYAFHAAREWTQSSKTLCLQSCRHLVHDRCIHMHACIAWNILTLRDLRHYCCFSQQDEGEESEEIGQKIISLRHDKALRIGLIVQDLADSMIAVNDIQGEKPPKLQGHTCTECCSDFHWKFLGAYAPAMEFCLRCVRVTNQTTDSRNWFKMVKQNESSVCSSMVFFWYTLNTVCSLWSNCSSDLLVGHEPAQLESVGVLVPFSGLLS